MKESGEMYLESIYVLSKTNASVHAITVSEYMNFSKPSVSRAMGLLKEGNFIKIDQDGAITLTEKGKTVAEKIYERHTILTKYLISLGVNDKIADEDACRIEHVISDESFNAIKNSLKK